MNRVIGLGAFTGGHIQVAGGKLSVKRATATAAKVIGFVTYESPWFPCGGIAAVMGQLPGATAAASGLPTISITPLHRRSEQLAGFRMTRLGGLEVPCNHERIDFSVLYSDSAPSWYFLRPGATSAASPLFDGARHPYDLPKAILLRDSLLFGAASVRALPAIAQHWGIEPESAEWNLIAQDWEAATALLVFASQPRLRGRLHLTLHNSYDEFAAVSQLSGVGIDPSRCPGDTILHRALSIVERPAFTVSEEFAADLTHDLVQREVIAPHLQGRLSQVSIVGVENGPFRALAVEPAVWHEAAAGNYYALRRWKEDRRGQALLALDAHSPGTAQPVWGDKNQFRRDDSPWLVMAGRDDPRQKGYDVAAAAIADFLAVHHGESGCAQFLLFPIPGDEGLPGLGFLEQLAEQFPQDVLVFPFRWTAGYTAAMQAAVFAMMPSFYEPFGMANEFYLTGACVGVARATGGNLEQIVPLRATAAFSHAVEIRASRYHALSANPTGILFREKDGVPTARSDWARINEAQYLTGRWPSRVGERRNYTVFQEMARELRIALEDGIRVYQTDPTLYFQMLARGIQHLQQTLSWERAGQEYSRKIGRGQRALFCDLVGTLVAMDQARQLPLGAQGEIKLELLPRVKEILTPMRDQPIFVVTNQAGIKRGRLTLPQVEAALRELDAALGGILTAWQICPHDDADGCACRKPRAKMIVDLAVRYGIDLKASTMVGDQASDAAAAHNAGLGRFIFASDFFGWERC